MFLAHTHLDALISDPEKPLVETGRREADLCSITLHLDNQFLIYTEPAGDPFTPPKRVQTTPIEAPPGGHYVLPPGGKVLACTEQRLRMPDNHVGLIQTKGSIGRGFLLAHACDGQVEPGYHGKLTLELMNFSDFFYALAPGMPIAQLFIATLSSRVVPAYSGRYQNSDRPTPMLPRNEERSLEG